MADEAHTSVVAVAVHTAWVPAVAGTARVAVDEHLRGRVDLRPDIFALNVEAIPERRGGAVSPV